MSLSMRMDHVISSVVQQELYLKGREGEAIHFFLDVSLSYYHSPRKEFSSRKGLHLLFHSLPSSGLIHSFSAVSTLQSSNPKSIKEWTHESSFDSTWSSDLTIFHNLYLQMAEEVNESLTSNGLKKTAPINMHEHNFFPHHLYQWVKVNMTQDSNDENYYRKLIEVL